MDNKLDFGYLSSADLVTLEIKPIKTATWSLKNKIWFGLRDLCLQRYGDVLTFTENPLTIVFIT